MNFLIYERKHKRVTNITLTVFTRRTKFEYNQRDY